MSRVLPAFSQYFDNAGDPLENGWLRFLISGTNNSDKDTYNDANQTILNENPLQLDAAGRCPDVFGQGIYRVVLYENNPITGAPGSQIQVFDPVTAEDVLPGAEGYFAEWGTAIVYNVGYIVFYNDNFYESVTDANVGNVPNTNPDHWQQIEFLRFWNQYVTYAEDDVVIYDSQLYFSKINGNLNNIPDVSPAEWEPTASGTILLNWLESGTTFMPLFSGYNIGAPANLLGNVYLQDSGTIYLGDSQDASIAFNGTTLNILSAGPAVFGTSTANSLSLSTSGVARWSISATGLLVPTGEYDIGSTLFNIGDLFQGDSKSHYFGSDQDAYISHTGVLFNILNDTGSLNIGNTTAEAINLVVNSVTRWSVDTSGNLIPSTPYNLGSALSPLGSVYQTDGGVQFFGTGQDTSLVFDGSDFYITTTSGNIIIDPTDHLILNGWTITSAGVLFPGIPDSFDIGTVVYEVRHIYQGDNGVHYFGSDQDAYVRHDGSNFYVYTATGSLILGSSVASDIQFFTTGTQRWSLTATGPLVPFVDNTYDIGDITHRVRFAFLSGVPTLGAHAANKTYVDPTWAPVNYSLDLGETKLIDQHLSGLDTAVGNIGAGSRTISKHTATAGQTVFTHSKTVATELVFLNGVLLWETNDYTFSGTAVTLTIGANAGDELIIITIDDFPITNALDKTGDTMTGSLILDDDPIADLEAATKQYVDAGDSGNLLINGDFDIWQYGTGPLLGEGYLADRWRAGQAGHTLYTSQQAFTVGQTEVPNNPTYYLYINPSAGSAASDYALAYQKIEDVTKLSGKTVTLSFWAKSTSAGSKIGIEFSQSFGSGGSASAYGTGVVKTLTTSWAFYSVTVAIPSVSGKTIGDGSYTQTVFWVSAGSDFNARSGSIGLQTANVSLSQIKLEEGSVVTPFVPRPIAEELALCHRYYWQGTLPGKGQGRHHGESGSNYYTAGEVSFSVPMRAAPTLAIVTAPTYLNCSSASLTGDEWGFTHRVAATATSGMAAYNGIYSADAEL